MPDDDDCKTPAQTPDAKKSSGTYRFNLAGVLCARTHPRCIHRRDEHEIVDGLAKRCMLCDCTHFFVGGMSEEDQRKTTDPEFPAVTIDKDKT